MRYGIPANSRLTSSACARVSIVSWSAPKSPARDWSNPTTEALRFPAWLSTATTPLSISKRRRLMAIAGPAVSAGAAAVVSFLVMSQLAEPSFSFTSESRG